MGKEDNINTNDKVTIANPKPLSSQLKPTTKSRLKSKSSSSSSKKKTNTKKRPIFSSPLVNAHTNDAAVNPTKDSNDEPNGTNESDRTGTDQSNGSKRGRFVTARDVEEDEEEKRLTALIFGGVGGGIDREVEDGADGEEDDFDEGDVPTKDDDGDALFEIDRTSTNTTNPNNHNDDDDDDSKTNDRSPPPTNQSIQSDNSYDDQSESPSRTENDTAAWIDEDDETLTVSLAKSSNRIKKLRNSMTEDVVDGTDYRNRLRERFQVTSSASARTDWATVREEDSDREEDGMERSNLALKLLSSTKPLLSTSTTLSRRLPPNILEIKRQPDANQKNVSQSAINAVQFHPGCNGEEEEEKPLLFTAGQDKTLRFFRILEGGERSEKVHGIHFPNLPIRSASFLGKSGSVVLSGRRSFFYIYDSVAGKIDKVPRIAGRDERSLEKFTISPDGSLIAFYGNDGYIILVEAKSKLWVANMKMNGSVRAITFSPDGRFIFSSGSDGDVYKWDVRSTRCIDRFQNEDGTITSALSSTSQYLAVGAESGVVNLYNNDSTVSAYERRTPSKSIMNLQSSIDCMKYNHDGRILAMSTKREKDSMKLFHVPSQTVFSNWPTSKTPLGYAWSLDFSPRSKFIAIGNDKGLCLLYKLSHYNT